MKAQYWRILAGSLCLMVAVGIATFEFVDFEKNVFIEEGAVELSQAPKEVVQEAEPDETLPQTLTLTINKGDTFASLLKKHGISQFQIHRIVQPLAKFYRPQNLRSEHSIAITIAKKQPESSKCDLLELRIRPAIDYEIVVLRNDAGKYEAQKKQIKLTKEVKWVEGSIKESFYEAARRQGIPEKLIHEMIMAYSFDVDFQRSLREGDNFGILFSQYTDPGTNQQKSGELMHAVLTVNKKPSHIYGFKNKGKLNYYDPKGGSVRKGLLRTPVDGARLSSCFGKRKHPILGYTKNHKGVDFAAPPGTPIMASGDGVIDKIGYNGAYGNYIRIRHTGEYSSAYAHLSRFAKGLRRGMKVRQGQVIGYIGSTGRSTGPHLHYEVIRYSKQINPLSIKMLPAGKLTGVQLVAFKKYKEQLDQQCDTLREVYAKGVETVASG